MRVDNRVDAALVPLLYALCGYKDVCHSPPADRRRPFGDVIGALARNTLRNAAVADEAPDFRVFSLAPAWDACFQGCAFEHEHVVPVQAWKAPLFQASEDKKWGVNEQSLRELRAVCSRLYLTAYVPHELHKKLGKLPKGWKPGNDVNDWCRYRDDKVTTFLRERITAAGDVGLLMNFDGLQFPGSPAQREDFVRWSKDKKRAKNRKGVPRRNT